MFGRRGDLFLGRISWPRSSGSFSRVGPRGISVSIVCEGADAWYGALARFFFVSVGEKFKKEYLEITPLLRTLVIVGHSEFFEVLESTESTVKERC